MCARKLNPVGKKSKPIQIPEIPPVEPMPLPDPPVFPSNENVGQCSKCGLQLHKVMMYVCPHAQCPVGLGGILC